MGGANGAGNDADDPNADTGFLIGMPVTGNGGPPFFTMVN
jgi:hypothetical protein